MNNRQRANLLKLAIYLESLPRNYKHFDMWTYADHTGACELPMEPALYAVKRPDEFLSNCGTVACAVGHGPAAGIKLRPSEINERDTRVAWPAYSDRVFGTDAAGEDAPFEFLFGSAWKRYDNHHYGAAARIRYYLDTGNFTQSAGRAQIGRYAPYRKGSRSATRREIDAVPA